MQGYFLYYKDHHNIYMLLERNKLREKWFPHNLVMYFSVTHTSAFNVMQFTSHVGEFTVQHDKVITISVNFMTTLQTRSD